MKTHYKGCAKELLVSNYVKESVCHRGAEDGSVIHWWCLLWSYKIYEIKVEQLESNKRIKIKIFFVSLRFTAAAAAEVLQYFNQSGFAGSAAAPGQQSQNSCVTVV